MQNPSLLKSKITFPDGQVTNYEYDIMDRLTKVADGTNVIAQYEYNKNSQLVENKRNDITTVYEYDELGQITELVTRNPQEKIIEFSYQYDAIGNITEEVRKEEDKTNVREYAYDFDNQLTEFKDNDYSETYSYDNVGNMLEKIVNGEATTYSYNEGNQLISEATNSIKVDYTYNANGDLTKMSTGEEYAYDIQGNLTFIQGNGINQSFTYNGNGNRLSKTDDGETTFFVNDINQSYEQVLQTYNSNNEVINTYTYGLQRIDSKGEVNETYLYDGRGSVVGTINDEQILESYSYTAYGDLMPESPTPKVFGFNGEQTDYKTGLQYLRARYYNVDIQRFIQEDDYRGSFANPISLNRYAYAHGNPVMGSDPSGNYPSCVPTNVQKILKRREEKKRHRKKQHRKNLTTI